MSWTEEKEVEARPLPKTKLCSYFAKGQCTKGDACSFVHELPDARLHPHHQPEQPKHPRQEVEQQVRALLSADAVEEYLFEPRADEAELIARSLQPRVVDADEAAFSAHARELARQERDAADAKLAEFEAMRVQFQRGVDVAEQRLKVWISCFRPCIIPRQSCSNIHYFER